MSDQRDNTTINTQDEFTEHTPSTNLTLTKFQPVTIEHVEKLLSNAANKMCQLDPIPTNIVKAISGSTSPLLKQGSHFSGQTKFPDFSLIPRDFPLIYKRFLTKNS